MPQRNGSGGHTDSVKIVIVHVFNFFSFSMNDDEAFRGAEDAPVMAVLDHIQGLEHQLAQLTQMVQTGVKLETVGIEERQLVKNALSGLDEGDVFNEAVAAQYHQAKQQQLADKLEVKHLHNTVLENVETWETASILYVPFNFSKVLGEERKFIRLLAKDLEEVDGCTQSIKNWVTKLNASTMRIS